MSLLNGTYPLRRPFSLSVELKQVSCQSHSIVVQMMAKLSNVSNALCYVDPLQPLDLQLVLSSVAF